MCGIAGIYNFGGERVDRSALQRMNDCLVHRGPDDQGIYCEGNVGLAMRRLAVVDIKSGHQPMSSDDGRIQLVFNGEIYNFQSVREELIVKGYRFKTNSDTEVLLRLYEELGPDCVHKLRGMFAFAIWDARLKRLLLARDRAGKKPLLYAQSNGRLVWASEMKALLEAGDVSRNIKLAAVDLYLGLQYIPSPITIFSSVAKLPAAHMLICENGTSRLERYWQLPPGNHPARPLDESIAALRDKFREATRLRMIADVPLGAFLSGGIDSTAVVGMMSSLSDQPVRTFAIGFEEQGFSELPYAREAANRFGTRHTEFIVKADMTDILPRLVAHYGEPFGDSSALPSYFLARETRKHVTVALTGDGGDENFAGYRRYALMNMIETLPGFLRRAVDLVTGSSAQRYLRMVGIFQAKQKRRLYSDAFARQVSVEAAKNFLAGAIGKAGNADRVNRLLHADVSTYLADCLMPKVDIATMANSLEARSPLLDHELMEMAYEMPGSWKLRGGHQKWIFKRAFADILPERIVKRPKMGFGIPIADWFRGALGNMWRERVMSAGALARGYFRPEALQTIFDEHRSGSRNHGYRMWNLLMLELWHEMFVPGGKVA
jgi:asparagine synthase (glutamine-hydrolysing)